ncbi:hypothetical protein F0237_10380 [Vibrio tubiashii]|uniref:Uncharacterized protein n=1 Tax=Vibrio tubiashii TaxID=29498 RepID=A0AAE5LI11_9VIBR|nr:hypothetical protein [Vibrio tubiashii]NOI81068.1 hypothetical protein [Vibrio tubiashii]
MAGVATRNGFLLRIWAKVVEGTGLPVWRVKQCVSFSKQRGCLTSTQPRHNENGEWYGLASIKRIIGMVKTRQPSSASTSSLTM